jgi:hypothetical protein
MIGQSPTLKDRNLEQSTTISLQREPTCFAFLCSAAISAPQPIDAINLDLASADYFAGRASIWTTLEIRSGATENRPTAVLGFDEAFLRPFTRALIEAAATRMTYRMRIADAPDKLDRHRVVEYVTGAGTPLRELIFTPHENVTLVCAAMGDHADEETLFQLPRSDSFLRNFTTIGFRADQMLRDTLADMERLARARRGAASAEKPPA